ncbi:MAG: hypothetical protein QOI48_650 [Solirubrobacteraceae bacterium]|jgi:stress response protein SCP2|nr:hypothetical protein [Solirubrobacteraceae bacterium]
MPDLTPGSNAALPPADRFEISVSYERQHADVICLLLDSDDRADGDNGVALFSQPVCAGGAVRLDPDADRVTVDVSTLPGAIARVLVVANADTCPTIDGTGRVRVAISADGAPAATALFDSPAAVATMQLVELYRRNGTWKIRALGDGYADGLARLLGVHGIKTTGEPARKPAPAAVSPASATPVDLTKPDLPSTGAVKLTKGQGVTLRKEGQQLTKVTMGLGWDPATSGGRIDLDASCVMLDGGGEKVEAVWFMHLKSKDGSIVHSGDNTTGKGEGDDETIHVDLATIPSGVQMLAFTVNSFGGQRFSEVANAFCRLLDGSGAERVRYDLSGNERGASPFGSNKGVVLATLEREGSTWTMTARGDLGDGRTYKGLMPVIKGYFGDGAGGGGSGGSGGGSGRVGRLFGR